MGWTGSYYVTGCRNYAGVKEPKRWFCAEDDAKAAGFRKAWTCSVYQVRLRQRLE